VLIADYAFLTEALPYALRPDARTAVVMHDLFSSRPAQFARTGTTDSVTLLDEASEMRLLGQAEAVLAIQAEEAEAVRRHLPSTRVIVAPMAAEPVAAAQPGEGTELLFVGSGTAPNVAGLQWFLDAVWPAIRRGAPAATLSVVGTVGRAIAAAPEGVQLLGRVAELGPLYARAAVVISPLHAGSGLKIKLVEALAQGKAVVATTVTTQGVEALVAGAVAVTDEAGGFAAAVLALLADPALRQARGAAALAVAREAFSPAACHAGLLDFLQAPRAGPSTPQGCAISQDMRAIQHASGA
jgi:succinoglycan biosynthesis protein ExoO